MTPLRPGPAGSRWLPVAAYAAVSAANQMLWLTFTPFTTDAAHHYRVSSGAIGWLAEIFPLVYVVLALPAGRLADRNMSGWLTAGAVLTAAGAVVRLVGDDFTAVLAGQVLIAIAQPLVLNAVTAVSGAYLSERDRASGIAVSSAGIFAGMVLALLLGAALGSGQLRTLLVVQAVIAVASAVMLTVALRRAPGRSVSVAPGSLRTVWADRQLRLLIGLVCAGFGVFIAVTTWLQTLLEPAGVSDSTAGYLLLAMVVAGVVGSALLPPVLITRRAELTFVACSVVGAAAALILLAAAPGTWTGLAAAVVLGVLLLTDLPLILDLVQRRAGAADATAGALVWLAGNAAGLIAAIVVQLVRHHPAVAFVLLAAMLVAGVPLLVALSRARSGRTGSLRRPSVDSPG